MRLKLAVFSLILLALPWLGWRYLDEMQGFLLDGQAQAQLLNARALAIVAGAHPQAFGLAADGDCRQPSVDCDAMGVAAGVAVGSETDELLRYAYPMAEFPLLDGYADDWAGLLERATVVADPRLTFRWVAATWQGQRYLLVEVDDRQRVYRHPSEPRLDTSDHLRLRLSDAGGQSRRLSLSSDGPGEARVEEIGRDWRYPLYGAGPLPVQAYWQETGDGYRLEIRLPLDWGQTLGIGVVDVDDLDDSAQPVVETLVWSPARRPGSAPPVYRLVSRSPTLQALLLGPDWQWDETVTVVDRGRWVRAASEGAGDLDRVDARLLGDALSGRSGTLLSGAAVRGGDRLNAVYPVRHQGRVIGAVLLSRRLDELRAAQWQTFQGIGLATASVLLLLVLGLLLFATRIAWRIRRLGNETARAIDVDGRVRFAELGAEARAADEFGELSRRISAMLRRLQRYTGFLESVPRTLRHEINNPLNTISTSCQNLADSRPELRDDRYLRAVGRGVARLERIVTSLTEAAALEQALRSEDAACFDLAALLTTYADSVAAAQPERRIEHRGPRQGILIKGSDIRIEQLLDKLVDNALDFTPVGGLISLGLARDGLGCRLTVSNDGPALPPGIAGRQFGSLLSVREADGLNPHLGMGLYIARVIAEHHGGELLAADREDGGGVVIGVLLPTQRAS